MKSLVALNLALLVLLILCLGFLQKENNDIWWHLKTGQILLETCSFPKTDIYSHTAPDHPWILHEWLCQVVFYLAYTVGGEPLLAFLRSFLLLACLLFVFLAALYGQKRLLTSWTIILIFLVFLFLMALWPRFILRPHLVSFSFLAFYHFILIRHRIRRDRWIYLLPLLHVIWINLHVLAITGIVLIASYLAGDALELMRGDQTNDSTGKTAPGKGWRPIALVMILVILLTFLNPYTYRVFGELLTLKRGFRVIKEWRSPLTFSPFEAPVLFFYWFYVVLTVVLFVGGIRRIPWAHRFLFVGFLLLSFSSLRNIELFILVTIPVFYRAVKTFRREAKDELGRQWIYRVASVVMAVILFLVLVKASFAGMRPTRGARLCKPSLSVGHLKPDDAVRYILENGMKGNIYNSYDLGGYLIWRGYPEIKVAIDGRPVVYGIDLFTELLFLSPESFLSIVGKYDIGYLFLRNHLANKNLFTYLSGEKNEWALVYFDDQVIIYVRRKTADASLLKCDEFHLVHPLLIYGDKRLKEINKDPHLAERYLGEARRTIRVHPRDMAGYLVLGYLNMGFGRFDEAVNHYQTALRLKPGLFADFQLLALSCERAGQISKARKYYKKALRLNPRDDFARTHLQNLD